MEKVLQQDYLGKIVAQHLVKKFGFIKNEALGEVFFPPKAVQGAVLPPGHEVCFHTKPSRMHQGKLEAYNIRSVFRSKDGKAVYDRVGSHLHAGVSALLAEVVSKVECGDEEFIQAQVGFNRVIGEKTLVQVKGGDNIVYAVRRGRKGHTKFVKNRQPVACSSVCIVLKRTTTGSYVIITAFIGEVAEPEPWDKKATSASLSFWERHALVYGSEEILPESLTEECPWVMKEACAAA